MIISVGLLLMGLSIMVIFIQVWHQERIMASVSYLEMVF